MQTLSASVWDTLAAASTDSVLIANRGSGRAPLGWLLSALVRTTALVARRRVDFVLAGDAAMYAAVSPVLRLLRVPSAAIVHGLDLTYCNTVYRVVVPRALRRATMVLANSEATAAVARQVGVASERVHILHLGIEAPDVTPEDRVGARRRLNEWLGTADEEVLCLTLGRVVPRKGAVWFVETVLPELPKAVVYVVAGEGEDSARVVDATRRLHLDTRVRLLGPVNERQRELLLQGADLFVQPNIRVPGDMEGFGLVAAEAATRGLLVVASDLEGISEAVVEGVTGMLLPSGDAATWIAELTQLSEDRARLVALGERYRSAARERFSRGVLGDELVRLLGMPARPSA